MENKKLEPLKKKIFCNSLFKIAGGNSTALINDCSREYRKKLSKKYLKKVEQVGFVNFNGKYPQLIMMGGELCINGTIAFASKLSKKGKLFASGIEKPVLYENKNSKTTIEMPLKYRREKNIILFEGIGYMLINKKNKIKMSKEFASNLAEKYNLPAFGIIIYKKNKITPYIYVKEVDSFIKETACGSGSIAFSLFSRYKRIIQPTGKTIYIRIGRKIKVSAKVQEETLLNTQNLSNSERRKSR